MVKAHTPINWQNKPSVNTPINETNLNKMDSTIGILDDRIIAHDTSKLDKSTANTMVKSISFDESTGVFTITLLNGSTTTIDTKLEKLAVNFSYDVETQQIVLELIDGTKQYIDLSALITQYEFTDSDTIGWEVTTDGKVKAKVLDGSITEDMLQPNYLADIKVETAKSESYMNSAKTSEINANSSANLAQSYAVGGTGTRDGEDTDNAKYYSENAKSVAQTITGTNPTATNSTNAPLIYGKIKGYTLQDGEPTPDNPIDIKGLGDSGTIEVRTCGKNLLSHSLPSITEYGLTMKPNDDGSLTFTGTTTNQVTYFLDDIISRLKVGETYIWSGVTHVNIVEDGKYMYKGGSGSYTITENTTTFLPYFQWNSVGTTLNTTFYPMVRIKGTDDTYEPYTETTATIPIDTLYEGDFIEVYADGSGREYRKMGSVVYDGGESFQTSQDIYGSENIYSAFISISDMKVKSALKCTHFTNVYDTSQNYIYCPFGNTIVFGIDKTLASDMTAFKTWLQSNPITVLYEKAEPTSTPLTAEQVEQFKKLYTFDNVTNFFCDGEITARYYVNTDSGDTVGMIQETVDGLQKTVKEIPDTYTTQSDFDRIVGGTVMDSGLTNIEYTIPTEISSAGLGTQSNNSGTLVDALKKATSKITDFFSTLYDAVKVKYLGNIALNLTLPTADYDFNNFKGYDRYTLVFKGEDINHTGYIREVLTIHNVIPSSNYIEKVCLDITNKYEFEPFVSITQRSDTNTVLALMIFDLDGISKMVNNLSIDVYGEMD